VHNKDVNTPGEIVVFGKHSNIGSAIVKSFSAQGMKLLSFGSQDCDFLNGRQCLKFFKNLSLGPCTIIFLSVISKWLRNNYEAFLENIALVNNFIEAQSHINVKQIIYFSSVDVYGASPALPISEGTTIEPDSWFGLVKYCCEWELKHSPLIKCPLTVLRIPGAYGNPHNDRSAISKFIRDIKNKGRIEISGSGEILRDYIHTQDIADMIKLLMQKQYDGTLNLATGKSNSLLEIIEIIRRIIPDKFAVIHKVSDPQREFDLSFNVSKLRLLFPKFKFTNLENGIRAYLDEIKLRE
jgi:nucleoside-diphosphate-sugar epimerase